MHVLFMGRKHVAARCLEWLLASGHTVPAVLTDSHLDGSPTAAVAKSVGIPLLSLEEAVEALECDELTFDFGASVVYWRVIPPALINAAKMGIINFHPAPLPKYKGTAGYNLAILEGLDEWAITAHYIDAGVDTGPIIEVDRFGIDPARETVRTLEAVSMRRMATQFARVVGAAVSTPDRLPCTPNEGGQYISRGEMEAMKLILSGDDVDRKIRAFWFPPYTGATVMLNGTPYTLVNQQILESLTDGTGATSLHSDPAGGW